MIGPRGHRAIELELGIVLPERGADGFELAPERPLVIALEEVDDDRDRRRATDAGLLSLRSSHRGQLRAQLLLRRAHAQPRDLGQRGERGERSDGQPGLVMVVVGPEQVDPEAGELLFQGVVPRNGQQHEAVHECTALSGDGDPLRLQAASSPDDGARTPDEKLRAGTGSLRPCRHELER